MSKGKVILGGLDLSGWALKEATADALLLAGSGEDRQPRPAREAGGHQEPGASVLQPEGT